MRIILNDQELSTVPFGYELLNIQMLSIQVRVPVVVALVPW